MLTSRARELLRTVETVIVDELPPSTGTKQGASCAFTGAAPAVTERPPQRIGLSATQKPLEEIGHFVLEHGPRRSSWSTPERGRSSILGRRPTGGHARAGNRCPTLAAGAPRRSRDGLRLRGERPLDLAVDLPGCARTGSAASLDDRLRQQRRLAERLAKGSNELAGEEIARAHPARSRGAARRRSRRLRRHGQVPCLVGRPRSASASTWVRSALRQSKATQWARAGCSASAVPGTSSAPSRRAHLSEVPRRPAGVRGGRKGDAGRRDRGDEDPAQSARRARSADRRRVTPTRRSPSTTCTHWSRVRIRSPSSPDRLENVLDMLAGRYPSDEFAELRPRIVWDRTAGVVEA